MSLSRVFQIHPGSSSDPCNLHPWRVVVFLLTLLLPPSSTSGEAMASPNHVAVDGGGGDIRYPDPDVIAHFKESYDLQMREKLLIHVADITPSSLHVTWYLSNTSFPDSSTEATVICETNKGTFVSDKVKAPSDSFTFELLHSNTQYIVCVYMLEESISANMRYLHYTCKPVSTIPIVRSDSIVGLVLTLGYLFLMGGLGYGTWWLKKRRIRKNEEDKKRITEDDEDFEEIEVDPNAYTAGPSSGIEANGAAWSKPKKDQKNRGIPCCTNSHVKFSDIPEEETIHLHSTGREITF